MNIRTKLPQVGTTIFTVMSKLAQEHSALNLSQGFPNFDIDPALIALAEKAMYEGHNQYAVMRGNPQLREAIAHKIKTVYKVVYNPDTEIMITAGATQAIYCSISAFVHPGDEVIVFKPAYDCYEPAIELNGGVVVPIQLEHPNYAVDWDRVKSKLTPRTRMIVINTPQNPCGTVFSKEDMQQLESLTAGTDIVVLSDEVYEHMVFDGQTHQSACLFPELKKRTIVTVSFGKTFHATGWKLGYCYGPKTLIDEFIKVHQFNVFCVNNPMQIALAQYMIDSSHYNQIHSFYQKKRDFFLRAIGQSRFRFVPSAATYFQLLDYSNITDMADVAFAKLLTKEHGIASIPMSVFNQNNQDFKVLRFCFAKTEETLQKAADILNSIE